MTTLRRRVRLWAMAWLILQASSLAAFVPRDCCAAHRPAAARPTCHDTAPKAHCPMRGTSGKPCPMHAASEPASTPASPTHAHHGHEGSHDDEQPPDPVRTCVMRGTCQAPVFVTVLSFPGIVTEPAAVPMFLARRVPTTPLREHPIARRRAPDLRPPRA